MNLEVILVALIAAIPGTLVGMAALKQIKKTHMTFNSKMDALLKLTATSSYAEGRKDQKDANHIVRKK